MSARQGLAFLVGFALAFTFATACASLPDDPAHAALAIPVRVENDNFDDAIVYACPCGYLECAMKLGEVSGKGHARLVLHRHHVSPDGRVYLAIKYRFLQRKYAVEPVALFDTSGDRDVVLTITSTTGQSFAWLAAHHE